MRYYFTVLVLLSVSALALAAPVRKEDVKKGDIGWARPHHLMPVDPNNTYRGRHPAIVISDVNAKNEVQVATLSHNHLKGSGPTKPGNDYADFPIHPKLGQTHISLKPMTIHIDKLQATKIAPKAVEPDKLKKLLEHIEEHCSNPTSSGCPSNQPSTSHPPNQPSTGHPPNQRLTDHSHQSTSTSNQPASHSPQHKSTGTEH